jgi:ribosomal protein S18 acetylase RimI-like enzyme
MVRGSHQFLEAVCRTLAGMGAAPVHSPALFPSASPMWRRAGFEEYEKLIVMERAVDSRPAPAHPVRQAVEPPWDEIVAIDDASFDGFWRMGRLGLEEALRSTRRGAVLVTGEEAIDGFAIVGAEFGFSYLQRLAVRPEARGRGLGESLVAASLSWASGAGARLMILNTQRDGDAARRLYSRMGFAETGGHLLVLRWRGPY